MYKNQVSCVYQYAETLAYDKHGVHYVYGVNQQPQAAKCTQIPEVCGNYAFLSPFGCDPLNKKPEEKTTLRRKPEDQPEAHLHFNSTLTVPCV